MAILTTDKVTEIFCITDDFCKNFMPEMKKLQKLPESGKKHRNRLCEMSESEIITILLLFHPGHFKDFKHFYLAYVQTNLTAEFPKQPQFWIISPRHSFPENRQSPSYPNNFIGRTLL
jgi:hypothetical protein